MGFESSRAARRRLAAIAATNQRVQEALSPSSFPGLFAESDQQESVSDSSQADSSTGAVQLQEQLDVLAHDIVATPGAGGALLAAYAAQARALMMVVEAARRGGGAPLPVAVIHAAEAALSSQSAFAGLPVV